MKLNQKIQLYGPKNSLNRTSRAVNFSISCKQDPKQLSNVGCFNKLYLSPYSPYILVVFTKGTNQLRQLIKFQNGLLKELHQQVYCEDKQKLDYYTYDCAFMKNSDELIIAGRRGLEFCRIQEDQWKTIQMINQSFYGIALSQDEQTLYCGGSKFSIFRKQKQKIRSNNWSLSFSIVQGSPISSISLNQSQRSVLCISLNAINLFHEQQRVINKIKRKNNFSQIILFTQDGFILADRWIIQWNQWSNKIIRQYLPRLGNEEIIIQYYDQGSGLIVLTKKGDVIICTFRNGQFIVNQTLTQLTPLLIQIGNNGLLMICRDGNELIFYE